MESLDRIKIVLVSTSHPGNIGAAARAMKNMGLSELTLVAPAEFPSGVAVGRAASALDILEKARVVETLTDAVADCTLVIGASARRRSIPWPMLSPEQLGEKAVGESAAGGRIALVFGREDSGLNNEELQLCHFHVQIPANPDYSSLNLAAAVMVICYEVRKAYLAAADQPSGEGQTGRGREKEEIRLEENWDQPLVSGEQVEHFYAHLERVLVAIDFHDPDNPRQLMHRMRRLFNRIRIDEMEMNILRGILTNIEFNLKDRE
jgi:tRNA (cytidine32/uridine32-2'-O)-methyltransferase